VEINKAKHIAATLAFGLILISLIIEFLGWIIFRQRQDLFTAFLLGGGISLILAIVWGCISFIIYSPKNTRILQPETEEDGKQTKVPSF